MPHYHFEQSARILYVARINGGNGWIPPTSNCSALDTDDDDDDDDGGFDTIL